MTDIDPIPELRRQLAAELRTIIAPLNPNIAARALGTDQPRVSDLLRDRLDRFSIAKLIRMLARVERPVMIRVVRDRPPRIRFLVPRPPVRRRRRFGGDGR